MAKSKAEQTADRLTAPKPPDPVIPDSDLLSTGCTLLNMAFSGRPGGGVPKGTYLYLVGDSGSSKTWFTFSLFAEAAQNAEFARHRFVFDNAENGALMDVARYFGQAVVDRLEPPGKGAAPGSATVQEFYFNVDAALRRGPCIYVLDSMDALQDEADEEQFDARAHFHETGKGKDKIKGSMGMEKAKTNSKNIARVAQSLAANGSILALISQTRDMLNAPYPGMKTRAGGRALRFYAHLEAWTKVKAPIARYYKGKDRETGALIQVDVQKNRVSGWEGKVPLIPFIKGFGVDDVGGNVDYLIDEKHWKKPKAAADAPKRNRADLADSDDEAEKEKTIEAPEFGFTGGREALVQEIQAKGLEWDLSELVARVWREIAAGAAPVRKPRYV